MHIMKASWGVKLLHFASRIDAVEWLTLHTYNFTLTTLHIHNFTHLTLYTLTTLH